MATAEEIAAFRLTINESADKAPYTDLSLSERLDAATTPAALAGEIWREKAATYAELVTVSESGSSRNLSDLHKNAINMAAAYSGSDPVNAPVRGTVMRKLTR